ncbi:hypothetical protein EYC84_001540 [Monilinia fructicola]|uniref:Uncharacterized protein n=1 Tax=Monilinia fructicola TaxID=38448 RepID=A0A5M9JSF1_MONFR|nr:hypothetical protein EYC84_001540 [Monilinia fructicola]
MYSSSKFCTLSLLSSLVGWIDAYPTKSHVGPSLPDDLFIALSPPTHQQPHTLYTYTRISISSQPLYPSRSSSLTVHPPKSSNPLTSSPLSLPFTLTSTCPHLTPDWSHLTSDLLTNILLLYPTGPTSSPYYTFSPASSSSPSSHDMYSISETVTLPTKTQGVDFRSTLHLSITPMTTAGIVGISREEWRSLIALLHSVNGMMGPGSHGAGFGRLEIGGDFPSRKAKRRSTTGRKETKVEGAERGERKLGPSDIIFTSSAGEASRLQEADAGYPHPSPFTPVIPTSNGEQETLFAWKATWVYYGVEIDGEGKEVLRECSQMPLGTEIDFERGRGTHEKGAEGDGGGKEFKDMERGDAEGEKRWKIDL